MSQNLERKRTNIEYAQSMIRELRDIVASDRNMFLAHLLDMAYLEASDLVRKLADEERQSTIKAAA